MKPIADWVRRKPIAAFIILVFAITWGLGFSYIAVIKHNQELLITLVSIATCGPALAGIIVTTVENRAPKSGYKRTRWIAFVIALIVGAAVFNAFNYFINEAPFSIAGAIAIFVLIVPPVAYVISGAFSRVPSVRSLLASLVNPRGAVGWSLIALIFMPCLVMLSIPISNLVGRSANFEIRYAASAYPLVVLIIIKFLYQFFFYNGTGEEAGWAGFARPRIQAHVSPLVTALIMTLIWAPWHAFWFSATGQDVFSINFWVQKFYETLPAQVFLLWIYNRSKGSILAVGIAHAAANTAFDLFPNLDWGVYNIIIYAAALVMILVDRMWKKLPVKNAAVYSKP